MLFQKNIEPRCTYCQRGTPLDEEKILCTRQGVVAPAAPLAPPSATPSSGCRRRRWHPTSTELRRTRISPCSPTPRSPVKEVRMLLSQGPGASSC